MVEIHVSQRLAERQRRASRERVDLSAAISAGFFAGAVLLLALVVPAVAIYNEAPWRLLLMIAATARGEAVLGQAALDLSTVAAGMAMHFSLSLLYALALAGIIADVRRWLAPWLGIAFGVALYFANMHGFTQLFPWFVELRTFDTLIAHALFGLLLARAYCEFATPAR